MNIKLIGSLLAVSLIACPLLYVYVGPELDPAQLETLKLLGLICCCSALYCFAVGEITGNNSQMDKLWSLLPVAYTRGSSRRMAAWLRAWWSSPVSSHSGARA